MSRLNLKPANASSSNHRYEPFTIASMDFGELVPVLACELLDSDNFGSIKTDLGIVRLAPQVFPPYGKCYIKNAAFFVPAYQLISSADAFHENMKNWKGRPTRLPRIKASSIIDCFNTPELADAVHSSSAPITAEGYPVDGTPSFDNFDFIAPALSQNTLLYVWRKLTPYGKRCYKILKGLGFDFPSIQYSAAFQTPDDVYVSINYQPNIMKLLAYCKIYCDMFITGPEYNTHPLVVLLQNIHDDKDYVSSNNVTYYSAATGLLSAAGLRFIFDSILLPHEQNMYTEAWNTTNSPLGVEPSSELKQVQSSSIMGPYNIDNQTSVNATDSYIQTGDSLSSLGLKYFNAFVNFLKRTHLAGSRVGNKVLLSLGLKSQDQRSNYVFKLFEGVERIKFSPTISNADTKNGSNGQLLGDYAGFGVSGINFDFDYRCTDYGYIVCLSWLQIVPIILRGFNPENLRVEPLDFYRGEFDGQAYRAIPKCELSVNKSLTLDSFKDDDTSIYGFTNLYEEYRHMRDNVLGDFVVGKARNYLFSRDFSRFRSRRRQRVNSYPEIHPQQAQIQYYKNRDTNEKYDDMSDPFQERHVNGDRFWLELDWNISANRPILSGSAATGLGVGEVEIQKNGNQMS